MPTQIFPAELESLHSMLSFIQACMSDIEVPSRLLDKIILAGEEALINIIYYGYPKNKGLIEISCEKCLDKPGIKLLIQDHGIPFNPLEQLQESSPPDPTQILEKSFNAGDVSTGGFGIHIFVGIMDNVEYQKLANGNRLSMIKYF